MRAFPGKMRFCRGIAERMRKMNEEEKHITEEENIVAETEGKKNFWKQAWEDYGGTLIMLAVVFVVFKFIFQLAWVPTGSMETTLPTRSLQLGWHLPYLVADPLPDRGDVVTFWSDEMGEVLVKRVIGLPGDTITYADGYVYRNGEKLDEDYLPGQGITYCDKNFTVPEGCFFVMGDNRGGSNDARYWTTPYIGAEHVQAKVLLCFSFGRNHAWQGVHLIAK